MVKPAGFAKPRKVHPVPGQKFSRMNGPTGPSTESDSAPTGPMSPPMKSSGAGFRKKPTGMSTLPKVGPKSSKMPTGLGNKKFLPKNW